MDGIIKEFSIFFELSFALFRLTMRKFGVVNIIKKINLTKNVKKETKKAAELGDFKNWNHFISKQNQ